MPYKLLQLFIVTVAMLWGLDAHGGFILHAPSYLGLQNGLVGHWTFDATAMGTTSATDLGSGGNTGHLINGPKRWSLMGLMMR
jgi:hypothetical protein